MKILGIDSSGLVASAAILSDDTVVSEFTVNNKKTHSQTLLPMIEQVVKMAGIELEELDAIAVAAGPGSFTGLRIGSATAKGLGLALDKPLIHIPTVDALACNLWGHQALICPLMDARRRQTYTGIYEFKNGELQTIQQQCAVGISDIVAQINEIGKPVTFLGDGVAVFCDYIEENCQVQHDYAPAHMNKQRAGAVAWLGLQYAKEGRFETAAEHCPDYLRLSQAERERQEMLEKQHTGA